MSNVKATLHFKYGTLEIIDFPKAVKRFVDFPDGRVIIHVEDKNIPLFFRVKLVEPAKRMRADVDEVSFHARNALDNYIRETYGEDHIPELVSRYKKLFSTIEWQVNPAAVKGTMGTVNLIHGASGGSSGNSFELYFPRRIDFRMTPLHDNRAFGVEWVDPKDVGYLDSTAVRGVLMFSEQEYAFKITQKDKFAWADYIDPRKTHDPEYQAEMNIAYREISNFMATDYMADQIRFYLHRWFPFIEKYEMLGEIKFNRPKTIETHPELIVE